LPGGGDYAGVAACCQGERHGAPRRRHSAALADPGRQSYGRAAITARHHHRPPSPPRSRPLMYALLNLVNTVITIYIWLLIIQAVLSWLVAFGVVNRHNRAVAMVGDFLWRITEPLLRPIRRIIPDLGGIDISPVILILLLYFIDNLMFEYLG
jgi:YggT family protein